MFRYPPQRTRSTDNDDGDNSDLDGEIVYREQSAPGDYPTGLSQWTCPSQSQQEPTSPQPVALPVPRHERKRRARELEERMNQGCFSMSSSESSQQETVESEASNAFAALESLLHQQEQQQQHQDHEGSDGLGAGETSVAQATLNPSAEGAGESADSTVARRQQAVETDQHVPACAPAMDTSPTVDHTTTRDVSSLGSTEADEFPPPADDNGWEATESSLMSASQASLPPSLPGHVRKRRRSHPRDHVPTPSYTVPCEPQRDHGYSLLETTRRMAMKQARQSANATTAAANSRDKGLLGVAASQRNKRQCPVAIVNSKSIVGTRPKHWGATSVRSRPETLRGTLGRTKRSSLSVELSKAAQTSSLMPPPPRAHALPKKLPRTSPGTSPLSDSNAIAPTTGSTASTPAKTTSSTPLSFAPSFLSSRASTLAVEQVEGTDSSFLGSPTGTLNTTLSPHAMASPSGMYSPTPKKSKNKAGPLSKRLKTLRDATKGDSVRFQCGQYPFSKTAAFDMNDPRNRAKSYMDVTILGESVSWVNKDWQRLTVLVYVHAHRRTGTTEADNANIGKQQCLAWLCVSFDTAREQSLCVGSELRMYNAVATPVSKQAEHANSKDAVNLIVMAQLCEPYPSILPKLANAQAIFAATLHEVAS